MLSFQEAAPEDPESKPMLDNSGYNQQEFQATVDTQQQKAPPPKKTKKASPGVRPGKMVLCRVQLLDGSDFEVEIDVSTHYFLDFYLNRSALMTDTRASYIQNFTCLTYKMWLFQHRLHRILKFENNFAMPWWLFRAKPSPQLMLICCHSDPLIFKQTSV